MMPPRKHVARKALPEFALWGKMKERGGAVGFDLEITARCNLRCRHCYINLPAADLAARRREMTLEEIRRIGGEAASLGAVWCLVTGGEPLLRDDFFEIYMALRKEGLLLSLYTNACLISEEHIRIFKAHPPRDVEVTVYGVTEGTYERISGVKGSYRAFRSGLGKLLDNGIRVRLKAMALRSNLHELEEIARFCRTGTKDFFRFDPFLHYRLDRDVEKNKGIEAERLTPSEVAAVETADRERFRALVNSSAELLLPDGPGADPGRLFRCGAGENHFVVGSDGKLRLCLSLVHPDLVLDLRELGLREAWDLLLSRAGKMRSSRPEYLEKCGRCEILNYCQWCPATSFLETGELDVPVDAYCRMARARTEAFIKG
jgi:radical SAM protein with 4Fe4S-binding SPASM domain